MNLGLQNGLGQWAMDTKVVSRSSMGHEGLLRRSNPENDLQLGHPAIAHNKGDGVAGHHV